MGFHTFLCCECLQNLQCIRYRFHYLFATQKGFATNLAPFLYKLKTDFISDYQNIVSAVQTVAPYFQDFDFNIEGENILLRWQQVFGL
jgi:hypothetical protein